MRSRRWKFAASLGLLLCLSASIAVGGFAADASVAEQGYPGGGDWGRPSQAYGYAPDDSVLAPDGHYYKPNSWTTVSEATCINKEKQVRYCVWQEWDWRSWQYVQCNHADYREVGEVDPNNHVNTIIINKKKATCTEEGYTGDLYCKDCRTTIRTGSSIPAKGHTWGQWKTTKKATCTEAGIETHECRKCGKTEERETKVLGHDWDDWKVTKEATCTETGVKTRTCKRDASHTETETIAKTGHDYTEKVVPPTCESDGYTIFTCNNCGDIYTGNVTTKLGHDYQLKDHKDATCTEAGYDYYECSRDALHNYTEAIPATGHDYTEKVVPPTCESDGYTIFTCNNCGDIYTGNVTTKLGHDYQLKDHKDATCTEAGYDYYECSRDALHNYTEAIPATGHDYTEKVVPPTCESDGYTIFTCNNCGDIYTGNVTTKLGHDYQLKDHKDATCTEAGYDYYECSRDALHNYTEAIPALGHDWNTTSTGVDNCVNVSFRHENETITLCPICGVQNGTQRLNKVTLYTAHAKLVVLRGVLENGMEAMTVAFYEPGISSVTACQRCGAVRDSFSSGASLPQAAENAHFTVDASLVDGYTVMLVQADGTETVLTPGISDGKAIFDVDMKGQGARLLHLVPTTAA